MDGGQVGAGWAVYEVLRPNPGSGAGKHSMRAMLNWFLPLGLARKARWPPGRSLAPNVLIQQMRVSSKSRAVPGEWRRGLRIIQAGVRRQPKCAFLELVPGVGKPRQS